MCMFATLQSMFDLSTTTIDDLTDQPRSWVEGQAQPISSDEEEAEPVGDRSMGSYGVEDIDEVDQSPEIYNVGIGLTEYHRPSIT